MNAAQLREAAQRVLLERCCDHHRGEMCECAAQVAADVDALISSGLLRLVTDHEKEDPRTPALVDDREYRTELIRAPAGGTGWSELPGWTLHVDATPVANTTTDLPPEAAQQWASAQLGEGVTWLPGAPSWYFVANPHQTPTSAARRRQRPGGEYR